MRQLSWPLALGTVLALSACARGDTFSLVPAPDQPWLDSGWVGDDADQDGVSDESDCAPEDPTIHPGADEICNDGVDNDCDEMVDADDPGCA